ncbi:MAG: winged helix-turn-helix domain-containing protein [Hylemonella sp.]
MKTTLLASPLEQKTRFRIQIKHAVALGPGKADVLQCIAETGSIAEAGRRLGMSYQTVWSLVRSMNRDFVGPLVSKQRGGAAGGGAALTPLGEQVLALYRDIEARAQAAVAPQIEQLLQLIRTEPDTTGPQAG